MFRYIIRRILISIPLLILASFLCFSLTTAMGDPLGEWKLQKPRTAGEVAAAMQRAGTDQPFFERYGEWAGNFATGDWGETVVPGNAGKPVKEDLVKAFGVTARLVIGAELIALCVGMAVGVVGAVRQYSVFDYTATGLSFALFSMPLFCLALLLKTGGIALNDWLENTGMDSWIVTAGSTW